MNEIFHCKRIALHLSKQEKEKLEEQASLLCEIFNEGVNYIKANFDQLNKQEFQHSTIKLLNSIKKKDDKYYRLGSEILLQVADKLGQIAISAHNANSLDNYLLNSNYFMKLHFKNSKCVISTADHTIDIDLGFQYRYYNRPGKNIVINAKYSQNFTPVNAIKYTICRKYDLYWLHVVMKSRPVVTPKTDKSIFIDPNHVNLFTAIDSDGVSFRFEKLQMISYFNKKIFQINTKIDICNKCLEKADSPDEKIRYINAIRKLKKALIKKYRVKAEQVKTALNIIAKWLFERYDTVVIGDYVPPVTQGINSSMRRAMSEDYHIGQFREVLKFKAQKHDKKLIVIDEAQTTLKCFKCGRIEKKDPTIRSYVCPRCGIEYDRDLNSAINIGIKSQLFNSRLVSNRRKLFVDNDAQYSYKYLKVDIKKAN